MYKHLSLLALAGYAFAQSANDTLNATLSSNSQLSNLTSFLSLNPALVQSLSNAQNITILAPNNDAFANVNVTSLASDPGAVSALLTYHVLNGTYDASQITNMSTFIPTLLQNSSYTNVTGGQVVEAVKIGNDTVFFSGLLQNSTVTQANVNFTGGVIHIVDKVLTLPLDVLDTATATNLTSFRGAVDDADLEDTVNNTPDVTIFAPTNEAIQSIGSAVANLSESELQSILAYHVVNGTVAYSSDLMNGTSIQTANGGNITITIDNGTVFVNAARVITPDVLVANGVVHIIDNVLNPNATAIASANATSGVPAFTGASSATDVPFTSGQPTPTTTVNPTSAGAGPASTAAGAASSSTAGALPMKTGAVGAAALFGGAAVLMNY